MERLEDLRNEPIGTLFSRLIDRARDAVRAEVAYYRGIATDKATAFAMPAVLCVAAIMIVQASLTVLIVALGMLLWRWIGPIGGMALAAVIGFAIAGLLVRIAVAKVKG